MGRAALCLAAALIQAGLGNIRVFECLAYIPATAVIILAAMFRMQADLPGRSFGPDPEAARYSRVVLDVRLSFNQEECRRVWGVAKLF